MDFRSIHTIETAENIHIGVELAGVANRIFAFGIDGVLMLVLMGVVLAGFSFLGYVQGAPELTKTGVSLGMFLVFFGYHLFQEWLWNGKTIGKSIFHIRVVRNNGQPIGFWESFGRNLLRVVDVYLMGIGLICMLFNRSEKRPGDLIAGTVVINDQAIMKPGTSAFTAPERLVEADLDPQIIRISPEEKELITSYQARRDKMLKAPRAQFASALYRYFSERWHRTVETDMDLDVVLERYQQTLKQGG